MRKIKLLIFAKSIDGGTGTYVSDMLELIKYSHKAIDIQVIALEKPAYRKVTIKNIRYWADEKYYPEKYHVNFSNIRKIFRELIWFKRIADTYTPVIILTIDSHTLILTVFVKALFHFKYKVIATIHNNLEGVITLKIQSFFRVFIKGIIRYCLNYTDAVVAVGKDLATDIEEIMRINKQLQVIQNTTNISPRSKPHEYSIKPNKTLISIGRLSAQKDFETLVYAFRLIKAKYPETKLWIIGDGFEKENLLRLTRKLGLSKNIKFLGWIQKPEKLLDQSDIFVLSTKREGFPYVLLEALANGIPIVASNCKYGPSEILGRGNYGLLTIPGNQYSLASSLLRLIENKNLYNRLAQKALERSKTYSTNSMLSKYHKLIKQLIRE